MTPQQVPLESVGRIGLAVGMAVFMGLAFELVYKRAERSSPGGIRTFPALALLGGTLYWLQPSTLLPFTVGLAAVALWLYAHLRTQGGAGPGLMVPVANLLAYSFGPMALLTPSWVVIGIAVLAVLLLEGRESLHRLVQQVPEDEVFTLGKFLILAGVVLPLLPNYAVVSWTPITPFKVWLAVVAVSTISYGSYLLQRYLPARAGSLLPAVLGGVYSSTVTTVALARAQRRSADTTRAAGIVIANTVMYLRVLAIVVFFNLTLALTLLPALFTLAAIGAALAYAQWPRVAQAAAAPPADQSGAEATRAATRNPLQMGTALTFAASFVAIALASSWASQHFGQRGILLLAGLAGVTDINPLVMTVAQGGVAGLRPGALAAAVLIAVGSNNLLQAVYALLLGGRRACLRPAASLSALGVLGLAAAAWYLAR